MNGEKYMVCLFYTIAICTRRFVNATVTRRGRCAYYCYGSTCSDSWFHQSCKWPFGCSRYDLFPSLRKHIQLESPSHFLRPQVRSIPTDHQQLWPENCRSSCLIRQALFINIYPLCRVGWARGLGYSPYNLRFREFRRLFHQSIGSRACQETEFLATQESENKKFLRSISRDPDGFMEHARQYAD